METLKAQTTIYEIEKSLGSGVTSQVYKAFRKDSEGYTKQPVALKIINSKKDVQVLKKEFASLLRVRSRYCVRVLAWENFQRGPALVLEFIDGVTLYQLWQNDLLTEALKLEILSQVWRGMQGLHSQNVFHGDLNFHNIMINRSGVVKLIDFGFGSHLEQLVTPEFASPERMAGAAPNDISDLFAFQKLGEKLLDRPFAMQASSFEIPRAKRQRQLARLVQKSQNQNTQKTCRMNAPKHSVHKGSLLRRLVVATLVFIFVFWIPERSPYRPSAALELRSQQWVQYSINGLPFRYGPVVKRSMRPGRYRIRWQSPSGAVDRWVKLQPAQTFLLKPSGE